MTFLQFLSNLGGVILFAMVVGSIVLWGISARNLVARRAMIPLTARQPAPWGFETFVLGYGLLLLATAGLGMLAVALGWIYKSDQIAEQDSLQLVNQNRLMIVHGVARVIACGLLIVWLRGIVRATWKDMGLSLQVRHLAIGALATIALLPPIFALQSLLTMHWDYVHPVLVLLEKSGDVRYLLPMSFVAVLAAPFTEEFLVRVVLQGWMERLGSPWRRTDPGEPSVPYWPIFASSLLFAMMHVGHGPAPISLFFLALGLGYLYRQTHSIWPSLCVHFSLNAITMIGAAVAMVSGDGHILGR